MHESDLQAHSPAEQQVISQSIDFLYLFALIGGVAVLARFLSPHTGMSFLYDVVKLVFFTALIPFFIARHIGWRPRATVLVVVLVAVGALGVLDRGLLSHG